MPRVLGGILWVRACSYERGTPVVDLTMAYLPPTSYPFRKHIAVKEGSNVFAGALLNRAKREERFALSQQVSTFT